MNAYTPNDKIDCFIVVPPQYRPQIYTGVSFLNGNNLRAQLTISTRKNENIIPLANGRMDVFKLSDDQKDLQLKIVGSDPETERVIEEIIKRNIPVYIYPRSGGNLQLNVPLVRGLGTDPIDNATATYTLTISEGGTVYLPRGDSGHGLYLEAIDTDAPLIDGVWTGNGQQAQLPAGRGMPFMKQRKNLFKDSCLGAITSSAPYSPGSEWGAYTSASDVWETDHGTRDSIWCADAKTYWSASLTTTLRSYDLSIIGASLCSLSLCYRVNGTMQINFKNASGVIQWSKSVSSGSGRLMETFTPSSSYVNAYIEFVLISGSYFETSCPQLLNENGLDIAEYFPFLGTSTTTEAEITANTLVIDCDMGADVLPTTATTADRNGAVLVSGYLQPMFSGDYETTGNTFIELRTPGNSIKARLNYYGSALNFQLYTDASVRDSDAATDHELGDIYAFGLWSGYRAGVAAARLYAVRLRDGTTFTCDYAQAIMFPEQLIIGNDINTTNQADGVLSAVTVESVEWSDCGTAVDRLADSSVLNIIRDTAGRWYKLSRSISPKKYKSSANSGTYSATEWRSI